KDEMYLLLPKHTKKPFGVLISSLVDIIEVSVDISEESYMEDGLLGSAIVQKQITLFVDIFRLIEKAEPSWSENGRRKDSAGKEKNRILLLEDAAFFRQLIKGYLTSEGHEVFTAENGQEGLSLFEEKDFDLIVSDIEMPVMDGIEFMKKVRSGKKHANVPAIAVTSLDSDKDKEKVMQSGFNKYQTKFDKEKFSACVAEFLG
ncbi:MAG: response regulator, partial [Candidatus Anammoxibacter sp.]